MRVRIIAPIKKLENVKKRVCAYARVSTENDRQGESLENQTTYYKNMISSNPEYEFVGVFADKFTGTKENRPEFQKMLEACGRGEIDIIYTKSVSRLARNTTIVLQTVRDLKEKGIEIIFEQEGIRTFSGDGELMLSVLSSFAEEESRSASENVKWRYRKKWEKGEIAINAKRFLGYDKNQYGELVINQNEEIIIKRIYAEYLNGNGAFKIAKILNAEGFKSVTGRAFSETSILDVLRNEKYKGDCILQKTYTVDHLSKKKKRNRGEVDSYYISENHSPIISKEDWEQVQDEMKKRAESKGNSKGSMKGQNRYNLSGMLYCSKCGAVLRRRIWNSKHATSRKVVWICATYISKGKSACQGTTIDDGLVENITKPTIIKEEVGKDGKKYYSYSSKSK